MARFKTDFSEDIRQMRDCLGLSQSEFGKLFGIAKANIAHWEQGVSSPPEYVVAMMRTVIDLRKQLDMASKPGKKIAVKPKKIDKPKNIDAVISDTDINRILTRGKLPKMTGAVRNCSQIARWFQFDEFYKNELALWDANGLYHDIPVREFIYRNRAKYLGKQPAELTDVEILRGFTISGVHKGYTVFDSKLMRQVLDKYAGDITGVFDPCAGWGERMLTCAHYGIPYVGLDVNENLFDGYREMIDTYGLQGCTFCTGNAADVLAWPYADNYDEFNVNTVITCPPYGGIEKYSDKGAENLSEAEFLNWWGKVAENAYKYGIELFCFQINTVWRDRMFECVEKAGFELIDEFDFGYSKSSHFTRAEGGVNKKKSSESMLVLKRR